MRRFLPAALLGLHAVLLVSQAHALPRYSARYSQDCRLCHQDPTGGGLRSLYASQYLVPTELAASSPKLDSIEPLIGNRLLFGVDLRTLFADGENREPTQLQMQTDVHVAVLIDDKKSIQVDLAQGGAQQAFGLAYVLPWHGWLKVGRFVPNYGWRFADHQLFARRYVLDAGGSVSPAAWQSTGMEVGLAPGRFVFTGSVDNGGEFGNSWTTSGVWRSRLGALDLAAGGSFLRRQGANGHRRAAGVFGYLHLRMLAWLAQWDEPRQNGQRERLFTQELSVVVAPGWTVRLTHGFHDPDRDRQSGIRQRLAGGLDVLATPFFGILAMVNHDDVEAGIEVPEPGGWSSHLVLHFLY